MAHPDLAEGRLFRFDAQARLAAEPDREELHARDIFLELHRVGDRLDPRDTRLPADIDLARPQCRKPGRLVAHHQQHELVGVGQAVPRELLVVLPVVGVPVKRDRGAADELVHHEGPGADHVVGVGDQVEGLGRIYLVSAVVQQRRERALVRLRQLDLEGQLVGGRHRLEGESQSPRRGLFTGKPADAVPSIVVRGQVVGGQLATVHRRLVVKEHVVADLEHPRQRIRVLPALRQVATRALSG